MMMMMMMNGNDDDDDEDENKPTTLTLTLTTKQREIQFAMALQFTKHMEESGRVIGIIIVVTHGMMIFQNYAKKFSFFWENGLFSIAVVLENNNNTS
mmetsp:Transcript_10797/g.15929  ORF Transcript_10797/g.15929 Transcript_10797/m.15929 type:complete len:97 (+) Transcript_10797:313-603(+)